MLCPSDRLRPCLSLSLSLLIICINLPVKVLLLVVFLSLLSVSRFSLVSSLPLTLYYCLHSQHELIALKCLVWTCTGYITCPTIQTQTVSIPKDLFVPNEIRICDEFHLGGNHF